MAITQLAVYDAVNAIERQNDPYLFHERGSRHASPDAAAASAARTSLLALLPSQQPAIDAFYQQSLAQIGSGRRVQKGIEVGREAADTILAAGGNAVRAREWFAVQARTPTGGLQRPLRG